MKSCHSTGGCCKACAADSPAVAANGSHADDDETNNRNLNDDHGDDDDELIRADDNNWWVSVRLTADQRQQRQLNRVVLIEPFRFERELSRSATNNVIFGRQQTIGRQKDESTADNGVFSAGKKSAEGVYEDTIEFKMQLLTPEEADEFVSSTITSERHEQQQQNADKDAFGSDPVTVDVSD